MKRSLRQKLSRLSAAVERRFRPDGASFIGAAICALSLFSPWVLRGWDPPRTIGPHGFVLPIPKLEWSFIDLVLQPDLTVVLLVLLAGIILSLFHRIGVVLQAAGLLGFAFTVHSTFVPSLSSTVFSSVSNEYYFGPGYFIALSGVFISMFAAKNFWWQRDTHEVVPTISRITALNPNITRTGR